MLISGVLIYIGLSLIDLDFALVFAVLGAFLVIIPYFGAFIGGIFPVLVGLGRLPREGRPDPDRLPRRPADRGQSDHPADHGPARKLHPALIAIGVLVVGQLLGIIGLFVAVPIISAIVILTDELYVKRPPRGENPAGGGAAAAAGLRDDPAGLRPRRAASPRSAAAPRCPSPPARGRGGPGRGGGRRACGSSGGFRRRRR